MYRRLSNLSKDTPVWAVLRGRPLMWKRFIEGGAAAEDRAYRSALTAIKIFVHSASLLFIEASVAAGAAGEAVCSDRSLLFQSRKTVREFVCHRFFETQIKLLIR